MYSKAFKIGIAPDPLLTVSQYADQKRKLPRTSSSEYGQYRTSRTPYMREPMDCLSVTSPVRRVVVQKPTQMGFTDGLAINWLLYIADMAPGPTMMILPTVDLAKRNVKGKIQPSLREMPDLVKKIRDIKDKRSEEMLVKEFPGGFWQFLGSNSAAALRSVSIKNLIKDDLDGWEMEVGQEGDPSDIVEKRTDSFGNTAKILEISTPTDKEFSRIEKSFLETDQSYFYVPCPHCKKEQRLEFGGEGADLGLKWEKGDPSTVRYLCKHCHEYIPEYQKTWMLENGVWIPTYPNRKYERGFKINSLYSPVGWVSWEKIVREFLKAKKLPAKLKVVVNTRFGETWEEAGDRPEWSTLKARAETYRVASDEQFYVPQKGLLLTAGVDVQKNRLAVLITAWGRGEECWILFWGEIFGDPEKSQVWKDLDDLLNKSYIHESEVPLIISCTAIDSGALTQIVYNYVRRKSRVIATKGQSRSNLPILGRPRSQDVNYKGQIIKDGVKLWPVGSDTAKGVIYPRLRIKEPGPGMIHFPMGLDDDFYQQMTAEKQVTRYVKGFPRKEWILPSGKRNEVLDCLVLNMAAAIKVGLNRMPWSRLEKSILGQVSIPNQSDKQYPTDPPTKKSKRSRVQSKSSLNLTLRH